ncbi:MAG: RNA 2',3'-cyclic phosphodiesterase [Candidatus Thorarchaeota archaeon]
MIRSFFAIDLESNEIKDKITSIQKKLADPTGYIAYVAAWNLHLTMKFLGDIEENIVPALQKEMAKITLPKFTIEFQGLGCLPSYNRINAIFLDITKGQEELKTLAEKIETACTKFGIKKEDRPFIAHLTIGRVKKIGEKNQLIATIKGMSQEYFGKMEVKNFKLKKSVLGRDGPTYTNLFEIKLE